MKNAFLKFILNTEFCTKFGREKAYSCYWGILHQIHQVVKDFI